jgi:CBS-domain-containing membrane protein
VSESPKTAVTPGSHERVPISELWWSWLGGFLGIAVLGYAHFNVPDRSDALMLITAFGSSAVIVFGDKESRSAQPRNLIGGHVLSALVGVLSYKILSDQPWLAASVATAVSIVVMRLTKTLHPPGGATALLAVVGTDGIHNLGFFYVVSPVAIGAAVLLLFGLTINNIPKN